jgi:agmatine deiminase
VSEMSVEPRRRMPAEWSPHEATWISWPHNADTWPGLLEAARAAIADAVTALAPHERVHINVQDEHEARDVERRLARRVPPETLSLETIPTDDAWIRDYGAIVVRTLDPADGFAAVDFDYNAWGGKYPPYERDRLVARQMAERLGLARVSVPVVLEGGSVDVNGEGLGLVTEQCLLNPNRNSELSRREIEATLARHLGLTELVWLGDGLVGDDTDGHVDNLARFVGPGRVVAVVEPDPAEPNHAPLAENRRRLDAFRDRHGACLEVVELPVPDPVIRDGVRLPASYANFYIANELVLVPAYGGPGDAEAERVLGDCFPGRRIVRIDCRALIVGLGALHCLTQQVPAMVHGFAPAY